MPSSIPFLPLIFAFAAIILTAAVVHCGSPANLLTLERAFPVNQRVELEVLKARDRARHGRLLRTVVGGVVDFTVSGTSDPYLVGLYFTKVKLGSPPREFNVQIDTGSDVLWVTCNSGNDYPRTSGLGIELSFFDASSSSTASLVPCSHPICTSLVQTTQIAGVPSHAMSMYWQRYNEASISTSHAPQQPSPQAISTSFPSMLPNQLQAPEIQASPSVSLTNTLECIAPVPSLIASDSAPSLIPFNFVPSFIPLNSALPKFSSSLTQEQCSTSSDTMAVEGKSHRKFVCLRNSKFCPDL